jgi:hypothetical protein
MSSGLILTALGVGLARIREMAGLAAGGGVRFVRPGAGSLNGDKPAAVRA